MVLIKIDRPLIDARNIRAGATFEVTGNDNILYNNRPSVYLTINNAGDNTCTIDDGTSVGQKLTLFIDTITAGELVILDAGSENLQGKWYRPFAGQSLDIKWDGSAWVEQRRSPSIETVANRGANGQGATCFGRNQRADGPYSFVCGYGGTVTNTSGFHCGDAGTASGTASFHACKNSTASGYAAACLGWSNEASGASAIATGYESDADLIGEAAHASGKFANRGDAQRSSVIFRSVPGGTTDATLTELFIDGDDDLLTILTEYTYACKITVCGRQDTGVDTFMGTYRVLVTRTGGAPALVGAVDSYENNPGGWGAGGGLPVSILAGATNLEVWVEGLAGHNIRWVAEVEMLRVGFSD